MNDAILVTLAIIAIIIYLLAIGLVIWQRRATSTHLVWLLATLILATLATGSYLLPDSIVIAGHGGRGLLIVATSISTIVAFGGLVLHDMDHYLSHKRINQLWLPLGIVWLVAFLVSTFASTATETSQTGWLTEAFGATTVIMLIGVGSSSLILLIVALYDFYAAQMIEIANRAIYWALDSAFVLMGGVLISSGSPILAVVGIIALLMGVLGAVYAYLNMHVFDIRGSISLGIRTTIMTIVTAVVIFGTLILANGLELNAQAEGILILAAIALIIATIYSPVRHLIEVIFQRFITHENINSAQVTRQYSYIISQAMQRDEFTETVINALNDVLKLRRAGLILVNRTDSIKGTIEFLVKLSTKQDAVHESRETISADSPVYETFTIDQSPITQFDIEYAPQYANLADSERAFFKRLNLSAYAPIILEKSLLGLLAAGPKLSDTAFETEDLELLLTLANQVGIALRNARLIDDLHHLNESMGALNEGLQEAKEELEKLDTIKTDFITIASHELRTPLAQIRGYTDIVDALNDQGMLDKEQTAGMIANLRKATERMEELVSAMLDVSQLDVNAMDLRFAQTTVESVLRMAIDPLTDAVKQRKLTLAARGLRGLPHIQADLQRLVQAFQNIIVNAIKFTRDGGRIDIRASLTEGKGDKQKGHILIEIADTGVGIKKADLELVFKKFYRGYDPSLHSTGAHKFLGAGPGLGLTIAKGVIEGHGGKVWVESPGHDIDGSPGATFYILLPLNPPENARRVLPFDTGVITEQERATSPRKPESVLN